MENEIKHIKIKICNMINQIDNPTILLFIEKIVEDALKDFESHLQQQTE